MSERTMDALERPDSAPVPAPAPHAGGLRQWWRMGPAMDGRTLTMTGSLMAVVALLGTVTPLATDMYTPSLPEVASDLGATSGSVQATVALYMVGMAVGQLFWGPLSDRFGRRRPLLVASILFVASSAAAAVAPAIGLLVAARFLQGFTGSVGITMGKAIARDLSSGVRLGQVLSLLGVISGVAPIVAPVLGGILAEPIGWRGIMWVLVGVAVIMFASAAGVVSESLPPRKRRTDEAGWLWRSARSVLADRMFVGYTLAQSFGISILFAFISGSSIVIQNEYGLRPLQYSLVFALNAVVMIIGGLLNSRLITRYAPRRVLAGALALSLVAALGAALLTALTGRPPLALLMGVIAFASLANGPIMANTTALALEPHGTNAGMAAAIQGAIQALLSGIAAQLVAVGGEPTASSMTAVMGGAAVLAALSYLALCVRPSRRTAHRGLDA